MSTLRHGLTPKMKPVGARRATVVAALDIGSSKVVCLIARLTPRADQDVLRGRSHAVEVIGFGHVRSRGIKSGTIVDLAKAEEAVRSAIDAAERMAGVELEAAVVALAAGRIGSELFTADVQVPGPSVTDSDIARVLAAGSRHSVREGRVVLHSIPIGHNLDDAKGIRDPRGMLGKSLGVDMHVATADIAPTRNLMLAVERCHLDVEAMVAAPYMAGLAVLTDDEAELGAACVELGAGTTTLAVFSGGHFVHADGFAVGGLHVTMDLARGLSTRISDAERIKTLHGGVLSGVSDERDLITVNVAGEDPSESPHVVPRSALVQIIKPRVEEILEMVRDRLAASPFAREPRGRIILTGGASQMAGIPELAARILNRQVRIGRPLGIGGLPAEAKGPAFSVPAGLLVYPQVAYLEHFEPRRTRQLMTGTDGYLSRVGQWLRDSF